VCHANSPHLKASLPNTTLFIHKTQLSFLIFSHAQFQFRNNVFNLSLTRLTENVQNRIEWQSSDAHKEMCVLKGKNTTDCQNYIRIFARVSERQIVLCGTNSFKPACRYYKVNPISGSGEALPVHEMVQEFEGEGKCEQIRAAVGSRCLLLRLLLSLDNNLPLCEAPTD
jgi:hypothetical protein